jgi:hypothetical protein
MVVLVGCPVIGFPIRDLENDFAKKSILSYT